MRIAQVVTLVSKHGAFGGPVAVAREQSVELAARGHSLTLMAGSDGQGSLNLPGVYVQLSPGRKILPTSGFSGFVAAGVLGRLVQQRRAFDVVHVHLARDLVTLPAAVLARRLGIPLVVQTHGMVMPDQRRVARLLDAVLTRPVLARAAAALVLTEVERDGLIEVSRGQANLEPLPNGVAVGPVSEIQRDEPAVVLFCARLHPRKRVMAFARMAALLLDQGSAARFVVAGPDEGDLAELTAYIGAAGFGDRLAYAGALPPGQVRATLRRATVFVLPSEREPFPMTLLEALAEGTPSVITSGCMIADRLAGSGTVVTDGSPLELAAAVRSLTDDASAWARASDQARASASSSFGIGAVVDRLEQIYATAVYRPTNA